jgi:hypothetical protein
LAGLEDVVKLVASQLVPPVTTIKSENHRTIANNQYGIDERLLDYIECNFDGFFAVCINFLQYSVTTIA